MYVRTASPVQTVEKIRSLKAIEQKSRCLLNDPKFPEKNFRLAGKNLSNRIIDAFEAPRQIDKRYIASRGVDHVVAITEQNHERRAHTGIACLSQYTGPAVRRGWKRMAYLQGESRSRIDFELTFGYSSQISP
jgi:hypothetical protein